MSLEEVEQVQEQEVESKPEVETEQAPSVLDLDSVERFKFAGREWTPKDFQGAYMMQSDYTRKTQALAEERNYYDNLRADLDAVKKDPSLAEKFKTVYPEKFHYHLGYVSTPSQPQAMKPEGAQSNIDPAFMERFNRIESELNERKIQAIDAEIDAKFSKLSQKFEMADEEVVIARAQTLLSQGHKLNDQVWEKLWKDSHERNQKLAEKHYSTKVNKQNQANQRGKDVASGGGIPGQAPKMPRTIKEAGAFALQELEQA